MDFSSYTSAQLLKMHASLAEELRTRGITRSSNNPTGDLAEYLFCAAFGWEQSANSNRNIDAVCNEGLRYQIKGRRITRHNKSRQLGAIRDFGGRHFDFLAAVLFTEEYRVMKAAVIPYAVVEHRAKYIAHTNSHKFLLHDDVWSADGVQDVTVRLSAISL